MKEIKETQNEIEQALYYLGIEGEEYRKAVAKLFERHVREIVRNEISVAGEVKTGS